jgi:hypothetical protein
LVHNYDTKGTISSNSKLNPTTLYKSESAKLILMPVLMVLKVLNANILKFSGLKIASQAGENVDIFLKWKSLRYFVLKPQHHLSPSPIMTFFPLALQNFNKYNFVRVFAEYQICVRRNNFSRNSSQQVIP